MSSPGKAISDVAAVLISFTARQLFQVHLPTTIGVCCQDRSPSQNSLGERSLPAAQGAIHMQLEQGEDSLSYEGIICAAQGVVDCIGLTVISLVLLFDQSDKLVPHNTPALMGVPEKQ